MRHLLFLSFIAISFFNSESGIPGKYWFLGGDGFLYHSILLRQDSTYYYQGGGDLEKNQSEGTWHINRDTVVINSRFKPEGFILTVKDSVVASDSLIFRFSGSEPEALMGIVVNYMDSTADYFPLGEGGFSVKPAKQVVSFIMSVGSYMHSKVYTIKNRQTNCFAVKLPPGEFYHNYIFFDRQKFLYKDGDLFMLDTSNQLQQVLRVPGEYEPVRLRKQNNEDSKIKTSGSSSLKALKE